MKFKFDANQQYQIDAVDSVVNIFEGQEKVQDVIVQAPSLRTSGQQNLADAIMGVYPNRLSISNEDIFENVGRIQKENKITNGSSDSLDFSVEMETGTGKTYVYLRTILELNKKYGWKKFIIIVPSVAIREGVIKTLQITEDHFRALYDTVPYRYYEYSSSSISQVKHFASSSNVEIMVMTMGAFNKDENVLYSERDQMQGEQPISYIQQTNPIIILDEPQNMEGEATQEKLKRFNALFQLRYSATHKNLHNLMYSLTPYDAYQLGLVKRIEVFSVMDEEDDLSGAYINLLNVSNVGKTIKARVEVLAKDDKGNFQKKKMQIKRGDDLALKTKNDQYTDYIVDGMSVHAPEYNSFGELKFKNGVRLNLGEQLGGNNEEVLRKQISETIRLHFEKKQKMNEQGIKVLSLFFIDKVDNYVKEDGIIRELFREEFNRLKKEAGFSNLDETQVHKGYFAMRGEKYLEQERAISENKEAYELIMKDKEQLLSLDEPTEFIFSHSALKEGWDNPNIFNICTLKMTNSQIRKRQEIGRGMRLCVDQSGSRIFDIQDNLLSVVANESYANYVGQLQSEFVEDGVYKAPPKPSSGKKRCTVKPKPGFKKDENFQELWKRISKKTTYTVSVDTPDLIQRASQRISELEVKKPQLVVERAAVNIDKKRVDARMLGDDREEVSQGPAAINCVEVIKEDTKLTANTVVSILQEADNTKSLFNNPPKFTYEASKIIKEELVKDYIHEIAYEMLPEEHDPDNFEKIETYKDKVQEVGSSIYKYIVCDSEVEKNFAINLDHDERIKLFLKLPRWFVVDTPAGDYNPDWAIVTVKTSTTGEESNEKIYFVIETKGDIENLRQNEKNKIESAKKHFEVIDVRYREVDSYDGFKNYLN